MLTDRAVSTDILDHDEVDRPGLCGDLIFCLMLLPGLYGTALPEGCAVPELGPLR
jgi:hypothetical protein